MSESTHTPGGGEHLISMANDMANYFRSQGREEAIAGIASHIKRYWTLRMRQKLNTYLEQGHGGNLGELPRAAVDRLNKEAAVGNLAPASAVAAAKRT